MRQIVGDFVDSHSAGMAGSDPYFHITRTPVFLDKEGLLKGMEAFERCRKEIVAIESQSAHRLAASGEAPIPVSANLAYFKVPRQSL